MTIMGYRSDYELTKDIPYLPSQVIYEVSSVGVWEKNYHVNTLGPRQKGRKFPDDIFKCIFLNENI